MGWENSRKHIFRVGQRVRLSQEGRDAFLLPRTKIDASGVVTKVDKFNAPSVRWDYRGTADGYAPWFIEPDCRPNSRP